MKLRVFAVWLCLCVIWSSTWLFIKLGLRDLPPFGFAGIRFVVASGALALVNLARGARWPTDRRDWALIALTGFLLFGVNYGALFWGEQRISSGLCAVLQATIPAFGLVFAHFHVPGERLTPWKVGGVVLGLAGVTVIFSDQLHFGKEALAGSASVVFGAAAAAYGSVLIKARGGHLDPAVLSASQMIFGWVPLMLVGFASEGAPWRFHWTGQAVFALFYLALMGSSLAFCMMYWLDETRANHPGHAHLAGDARGGGGHRRDGARRNARPARGARRVVRAAGIVSGDLPPHATGADRRLRTLWTWTPSAPPSRKTSARAANSARRCPSGTTEPRSSRSPPVGATGRKPCRSRSTRSS